MGGGVGESTLEHRNHIRPRYFFQLASFAYVVNALVELDSNSCRKWLGMFLSMEARVLFPVEQISIDVSSVGCILPCGVDVFFIFISIAIASVHETCTPCI